MGFFDFLKDLFNPVKPGAQAPAPASRPREVPAAQAKPARAVAGISRPLLPGLIAAGSPTDLASLLKTPLEQLAWLSRGSARHYMTWQVPKSHGQRTIEAPKKKLRAAQRRILAEILSKIPPSAAAHGFVKGRSPKSNALPHVGKAIVIKLDLRDFFWQVTGGRVGGLFRSFGYPREVAAILWKLCCNQGRLPQGAPTSPAITNLCCRRLDSRLAALAKALQASYTRYADDLTFSFESPRKPIAGFLRTAKRILRQEGFRIAPEKTRYLRATQRQSVTGITVNRKVSPPRREVRALRALLHEASLKGASVANRDHVTGFSARVRGRIEAVRAIDKAKGEKLLRVYERVNWGA